MRQRRLVFSAALAASIALLTPGIASAIDFLPAPTATVAAGGFAAAPGSPVSVGTNPYSVAIGDLNADGRPDLAVANLNSNNVSVLLGNGAGGFAAAAGSPVSVGTSPDRKSVV